MTACTTCQGHRIVDESGCGYYEACADCAGSGRSFWQSPKRLYADRAFRRELPVIEPVSRAWIWRVCVSGAILIATGLWMALS